MLFHVLAAQTRIMPYWPLFGFVALLPLQGRAWAEGLKTHPAVFRRRIPAVALFPVLLAALISAQARFGLLDDSQGRLLGLIAPNHDPNAELICWDQVASELERRGLLSEPRTFLFTDSWDRSAGLALATRGKPQWPATTSNPGATYFGAVPKTGWAAMESSSRASERPALSRYHRFFTRYEPIGTVPIVRRGVLLREVYLYRGTYQTCPFPFDGRFRDRARRPRIRRGSPAGLADSSPARRRDDQRGSGPAESAPR